MSLLRSSKPGRLLIVLGLFEDSGVLVLLLLVPSLADSCVLFEPSRVGVDSRLLDLVVREAEGDVLSVLFALMFSSVVEWA